MKRYLFSKNAFTLVELLLVIGILGVLAVTLLVGLNPVEIQRKARDTQRMKDLSTLQAVVQQGYDDGLRFCDTTTNPTLCSSNFTIAAGGAKVASTAKKLGCSSWIGTGSAVVSLCNYTKTLPADPLNGQSVSCADSSGTTQIAGCTMAYYIRTSGLDYEIAVRQESQKNIARIANDSGNNIYFVEVFSNKTLNNLIDPTDDTLNP